MQKEKLDCFYAGYLASDLKILHENWKNLEENGIATFERVLLQQSYKVEKSMVMSS
jgi:hypothetical protein